MTKLFSLLKLSVIFTFLFYCATNTWAQKAPSEDISRHKFGIISGLGDQVIFPARYNYEVTLFQLEYSYTFLKKEKWNWEAVLQPQYNLSNFTRGTEVIEEVNGKELGLSAGLLARTKLIKDIVGFYGIIGAGPHYISDSPPRQRDGFIFSTYLNFGLTVKLINHAYFDLRPGFRHISNAWTKRPNNGLNTFTLSAGMMIEI